MKIDDYDEKFKFFDAMDKWKDFFMFSSASPKIDWMRTNYPEYLKLPDDVAKAWLQEYLSSNPSWQILFLLNYYFGSQIKEKSSGKFYHQIVDWMDWFEKVNKHEN